MESISVKFGKVVKQIRQQKKLSQEKLAEMAGLDRTFVSLIERGRRRPTLESAARISKALNLSLSWMVATAERKRD